MANQAEVKEMLGSIKSIKNDVELKLYTAIDAMEKNLALDMQQKELLVQQIQRLADAERLMNTKFEEHLLQNNIKQSREKVQLQKKLKNEVETIKQDSFKSIEEKIYEIIAGTNNRFINMETNLNTMKIQLKKLFETNNEKLSTLENEWQTIHNEQKVKNKQKRKYLKQLLHQDEQCLINYNRSHGFYLNWDYDEYNFTFLSICDLKNAFFKLKTLDVTVQTERNKAITLIQELLYDIGTIIVTGTRRFPLHGVYIHERIIRTFILDLSNININNCVDVNFTQLRSDLFNKYSNVVKTIGLKDAHDKAWADLEDFHDMPVNEYLLRLWLCSSLINVDVTGVINKKYFVHNLKTFEDKYELIWKE